MPQNDVFELRNSSFNAFLFAEVGTEQNGSPLTILSTLARLGKDPWAQAAEWARMPNAATTECLTQSIMQMPLCKPALVEAHATAGRLVMLLPRQSGTTGQTGSRTIVDVKLPAWLPLAVFCAVMGLMVMAGTYVASSAIQAPVAQSVESGQ
jgi:hypothetical protein